ncbi:MAG: hypothetical protein DRH44_04535 [Candidatus Coatesbacteria bacterium]|nr:MAG: hypothetical protein DRH49_02735 [Candidatus Coatesbacteria bacterium]RLC43665.1 MAG: hypothetical protein DRH44_04535 [Candidatus Coatesbacteria bacterium]
MRFCEDKYEVKVDLDIKKDESEVVKTAEEICRRMYFIEIYTPIRFGNVEVYETRRGFHLYIEVKEPAYLKKNKAFIVALQLLLMSDWKREVFNLSRVMSMFFLNVDYENWNILFYCKRNADGKYSTERRTYLSIMLEQILRSYETVGETIFDNEVSNE